MATIKVQVDESGTRRVITKVVDGNRLVSCACCGGECCVYPASCGIGPEAVEHYGSTIAGSGTSFGDTTNGVILESGVWAVYRNGVRTERDCLGLATGAGTINVAASLATSYAMAFDWIYDPISDPPGVLEITATLSYINTAGNEGVIGSVNSEGMIDGAVGQCGWFGSKNDVTQQFDEGFALFFNTQNCRWEITSGPINLLYGYRESDMPTGVYTSNSVDIENITIS